MSKARRHQLPKAIEIPPIELPVRAALQSLAEAKTTILDSTGASAEKLFMNISFLWNGYLENRCVQAYLTAREVAQMLQLVDMARSQTPGVPGDPMTDGVESAALAAGMAAAEEHGA